MSPVTIGKGILRISFLGICAIAGLFFLSCAAEEPDPKSSETPVEFNPVFVEKEYVLKNGDEKLAFLTNWTKRDITNREDFEDWLHQRIENLVERNRPYNPADLIELVYGLYQGSNRQQ